MKMLWNLTKKMHFGPLDALVCSGFAISLLGGVGLVPNVAISLLGRVCTGLRHGWPHLETFLPFTLGEKKIHFKYRNPVAMTWVIQSKVNFQKSWKSKKVKSKKVGEKVASQIGPKVPKMKNEKAKKQNPKKNRKLSKLTQIDCTFHPSSLLSTLMLSKHYYDDWPP